MWEKSRDVDEPRIYNEGKDNPLVAHHVDNIIS